MFRRGPDVGSLDALWGARVGRGARLLFLLSRRANQCRNRHDCLVAIIALLSSFGGYGLGWVVRSFYMSVGEVNESIGIPDEWGSLQWLWVETILGIPHSVFSKWLTLFSWACCLLAGNGLSQLLERPYAPAWFRRLTILTICVSIAIALLSIPTFRDSLFARWQQIPSGPALRPVSPEAARSAILLSLGHGMMAMILTLSLFLFETYRLVFHGPSS